MVFYGILIFVGYLRHSSMNPLLLPSAIGYIVPLLVFYEDDFSIK